MKISYCITTHNEDGRYIRSLLDKILSLKDDEDEIIILDDLSDNPDTISILEEYKEKINYIIKNKFKGNFAEHKNKFSSVVNGDWIVQFDADELPNDPLIKVLKETIINNPDVDLYFIPRINIVEGLTPDDVNRWGWNVDNKGVINYPDWQGRIYRNKEGIKWEGKIHERIIGAEKYCMFPSIDENNQMIDDYCILHIKNIDRQRQQNELYNKL